jgi:hypothetical protein
LIQAAQAAATSLKRSVVPLRSAEERELALGVSEGMLKSSGHIILGSVSPETYQKIGERARSRTSQSIPADRSYATDSHAPAST